MSPAFIFTTNGEIMARYILNGWSWSMPRPENGLLVYHTLPEKEFKLQARDAISCVSHPALANILDIPCNSEHIKLNVGDVILVVYTNGGKLSHEARTLPPHISLEYKCVKILEEI